MIQGKDEKEEKKLITDGIFKFAENIKQAFCIHKYEKHFNYLNDSYWYKCSKCGRTITYKPPEKLIKQDKKN